MKSIILFFSLLTIVIFLSESLPFGNESDLERVALPEQQSPSEQNDQRVDKLLQDQKLIIGTVARSYIEREEPAYKNDRQSDPAKRAESNVNCRPDDEQREMLRLVNNARARARECGDEIFKAAPSLSWNCRLKLAAFVHSQDMIDYDYFDHEGSDGSSVGVRVSRSGYDWRAVGENIAAGYPDNKQVMENLLSSPTHCENIMDPKFREFGFAVIATDQAHYYNYWTQVFARQ